MIEIVFWSAATLIVYVYAGYPLLLGLVRALGGARRVAVGEHRPPLTLIVSAYNEAEIIGEKIANSLSLDYPADRLEVLVVSDCSSDATDAIVAGVSDPRVRLIRMAERGGKTLGLNAAAREARGEILVFSDANAIYLRDALVNLTRNFADAQVGAVIGESTYSAAEGGADEEESLYWKYEIAIKRLESAIGSVVGGDGAIYAIRKALYRPMRADALSDFVNPLQIVRGGHRCVYEPAARSVEKAAGDFDREFRRKVRIVNRAWRAMMSMKDLLNPLRHGLFAFEIISHKLLRWLVPLFMALALGANFALAGSGWFYAATLTVQLAVYLLVAVAYPLRQKVQLPRLLAVPFYFVMVNIASARGIVEAYLGKTYTTWTTARAVNQ
ncbi:MAG TPA: glycosyltransferase family 2 protein [Steroidobacteraceae bacterium]|jgi:glycosyltransferase involved in cell wall biosynthesis|nr:glycosyltransferase family 2 protein [Steroidobacteraceae bacterium]